jgi:hypothetical protein
MAWQVLNYLEASRRNYDKAREEAEAAKASQAQKKDRGREKKIEQLLNSRDAAVDLQLVLSLKAVPTVSLLSKSKLLGNRKY